MHPLIPPIQTADGQFRDGNPATGELGTIVNAEWLNRMQQATRGTQSELINLVQAAGMKVDAADEEQVVKAVRGLGSGAVESHLHAAHPHQQYLPNTSQVAFRNKLINGNFDVWQRGNEFTLGPASYSAAYAADRWCSYVSASNGNTGVGLLSRKNWMTGQNPVLESAHYLSWAQTDPGSACIYRVLSQKIEDVRTLVGRTASLSFIAWADSNISVAVDFWQYFGNKGHAVNNATYATADAITISLTTTPKRYILHFDIPSIAGAVIAGDDDCLSLRFHLPTDKKFIFNLATVQLEEGHIATPFEVRPRQVELGLCQRYFEKSYDLGLVPGSVSWAGHLHHDFGLASTSTGFDVRFTVPKRSPPAVVLYSQLTGKAGHITVNGAHDHPGHTRYIGNRGFQLYQGGSSTGSMAAHYTADAEL